MRRIEWKNYQKVNLGTGKSQWSLSDGVWHTGGHFSKNGSFIIKNDLSRGLLWFGHKCMRARMMLLNMICTRALLSPWKECWRMNGTNKQKMKVVILLWCGKMATPVHKNQWRNIMEKGVFKVGGHVGRAHTNNLQEAAKLKQFSETVKQQRREQFSEVDTAKCQCKCHSQTCGYLSEQFIKGALINHFCCLQQCTNPAEYAQRMRALGEFHSKDIHKWKKGECGFHDLIICSCGHCEEDGELKCEGKQYSTKHKLPCSYHHLAYRIEWEWRAEDARAVIHPEMGKGHSNLMKLISLFFLSFMPRTRASAG